MRLLTVLLQCSALLQCAAAKDAYLYTFNDERRSPSTNPSVISSDTAFAIVSRRQGLAYALSLEGMDEEALSQIAEHGGYQQPLFSETTNKDPARMLVRLQVNNPETLQLAHEEQSFKIQNPTKALSNLQTEGFEGKHYTFKSASKEDVQLVYRLYDTAPTLKDEKKLLESDGKSILETLDVLKSFLNSSKTLASVSTDFDFTSSKRSQSSIAVQIDLFISYLQSCGHQPTLLILPPMSQLASSATLLTRRQESEEEPLDLIVPSTPDVLLDAPSMYKSNATLPRRFPSCFGSKELCVNGTNSCSGHGTCQASGTSKNCFKCKCGRTTIRTNKDGSKKTTLWAGGACQKKDISVEFTLFAVFGVTMASLLMGVIGMMYTMGAQELPSVIGAGVAGPSARK